MTSFLCNIWSVFTLIILPNSAILLIISITQVGGPLCVIRNLTTVSTIKLTRLIKLRCHPDYVSITKINIPVIYVEHCVVRIIGINIVVKSVAGVRYANITDNEPLVKNAVEVKSVNIIDRHGHVKSVMEA